MQKRNRSKGFGYGRFLEICKTESCSRGKVKKMRRQIAYNMDCMDLMKLLPDNEFDLAIVDPPYGGGTRHLRWTV